MRNSPAQPCSGSSSPRAALPGAGGAGQRQLGGPRPRLRPRGRDEPVRRLRLRQARQGLPLHPRPLLPGDARSATLEGRAGRPRPARHLAAATSASATRPAPAAWRSTPPANYEAHRVGARVKLRSSGGKPLADCGRKLRAAGDGRIAIAGARHLPRRARGGADRKRRRLAQRDQRAAGRAVRQGRDPERVAALLAGGGAAGAGGRVALLRAHRRGRRQRLRPLRRHPQPGLRGPLQRDRDAPTPRPTRPGARS